MADDMLVVRIVVPHEDMMTKAMRFSASKTIREVLFETAQNLCNSGIEIPDVINFNFKYEPEDQITQPKSPRKSPRTSFIKKSTEPPPLESYWLKKVKTLGSYNFSNGVSLRFERNRDFNKSVAEVRSKPQINETGKLELSGENEKVKFLTKGRFTRNTAATEIYTTEKTYVEQLTVIVEHFIIPTKEKKLISDSGLSLMFTELMSIQQLHVDFLSQMEQRIKNWSNASQLGDIFSKLLPYMKMYGNYCSNYEANLNKFISLCDENPQLAAWAKECEEKEELTLNSIGSYLITPVQRIPRYRMLFEQLLKLTPPSHADHEILNETLKTVNDVADFVNNYQRDDKKLAEIKQQIDGLPFPLLVPGRKLIHIGNLKKISSRATQERRVYLFNDILVYCLPKKEPYLFKGSIPLDGSTWIRGVADTKVKNAVQLVGQKKTYTFVANTAEEKYEWNRKISSILADHTAKSPMQKKNSVKVHDRGGFWSILTKSDKLKDS